ncbi:hypothetical protein [Saccharothrix syringae]|uniref:hypothetical protein n=1 Tax=Saccharothrix syringae TaxID=103733 RepID=UPI001B7FF8A2|nr:hypothetical protein [Saccharothrix syringae]
MAGVWMTAGSTFGSASKSAVGHLVDGGVGDWAAVGRRRRPRVGFVEFGGLAGLQGDRARSQRPDLQRRRAGQRARFAQQPFQMVVQVQAGAALGQQPLVPGDLGPAAEHDRLTGVRQNPTCQPINLTGTE